MRSATRKDYEQRILRVLLHIQQHLDEAISLHRLAEVTHLSVCHFHRIFRGMVGESLKQHIRRLRLERAAVHLTNPPDPDVTAPGKIRYDACLVVDDRCRGEGSVGVQEIRGGEYAVTTHCGPYGRLGETYARRGRPVEQGSIPWPERPTSSTCTSCTRISTPRRRAPCW